MKNLFFTFLFCLVALMSLQAQFKISDRIISTGFNSDTATSISIKVVTLDVKLDSKAQRPVFYLSFNSKTGSLVDAQNIGYDDMVKACKRNNIPESQHETVIAQTFLAVLCGNKSQKLGAIRSLLWGYGIILKPDEQQ